MHCSPRIAVFSDGERFPYLEGDDGLMSFWPTLFSSVELRGKKNAAGTIRNGLNAISHLHAWEQVEGRNLLKEFLEQQFPTIEDIESLRDHCYRDARDLKKYVARVKQLSACSLNLVAPVNQVPLQTVQKSHAYNRMTVIGKYLYFCAVTLLRGRPNAGALYAKAKSMRDALLAHRPKGKTRRSGLSIHPSPEYFDEFLTVVAEDSPDNPFKSPEVRLRNYVMFQIIFETGIRSGELLSLYVGDVTYDHQGGPIIRVIDRPDDQADPRTNAPQVKTLERDIPISQGLFDKTCEYITVRYATPNARKHPLLFVNHKNGEFQGLPMSDRNFQRELKRVVAVRPERFKDIRRHGFRHNFNVRLTDKLDLHSLQGKPLTDKQRLEIRKNLNGHKGDSSGEVYEQNATRQKAHNAIRQYQDKNSSYLKAALEQAKGSRKDVDD